MRIAIGADHDGYPLNEGVIEDLNEPSRTPLIDFLGCLANAGRSSNQTV